MGALMLGSSFLSRGMMLGGGSSRVPIILLLYGLELLRQVVQLPRPKPALTLSLMAANAVAFFGAGSRLLRSWLTVRAAGLQPQRCWLLMRVLLVAGRGGARRLRWGSNRGPVVAWLASKELGRRWVASQFLHADALHLYYNMTSLLWKGTELERRLGPRGLARLVAFALLVGPLIHISSSATIVRLGYTRPFRVTCVGFSGVLFAMKAAANHIAGPGRRVTFPLLGGGFSLDARLGTWVELLLIQLLVPNTSFVGHLSGLLAGMLWTQVPSLPRRAGGANGWGRQHRGRGHDRSGGVGAGAVLAWAQQLKRWLQWMQRRWRCLVSGSSPQSRPRFHGSGTTRRGRGAGSRNTTGAGGRTPADVIDVR